MFFTSGFKPLVYTTPQGKEEYESVFLNVSIGNTGERLKYEQDEDKKRGFYQVFLTNDR